MMTRVQGVSPVPTESDAVTIANILHYPLLILKVFGVFIECPGDKFKLTRTIVGKLILNTVSVMILVSIVTRTIVGFVKHDTFSDKLMGRIVFAVLYISVTIMFPVFIVTTTRSLPDIQLKFSGFQREFGFAADIRKMQRIVTATLYVIVILSLIYGTSIIVLTYLRVFDESGLLISRLLPFGYDDGFVFDLVSVLDSVATLTCTLIMGSEMIIVIVLSQIIIKEFQEVNRKLKIAKEIEDVSASKLQRLRHHHYEVTELLQTANSIMQLYVFFTYIIVLPGLCFTIYGIVYSNFGIFDILSLVSIFLIFLLGMILMTGTGAKVNSQVIHKSLI